MVDFPASHVWMSEGMLIWTVVPTISVLPAAQRDDAYINQVHVVGHVSFWMGPCHGIYSGESHKKKRNL